MLEMKSLLGETSKYDKKEILELQKPKSWLKSVSAFANSFGGMLLWGISDKDECIGLKDAVQDAEKISEFIKDRMDPIPQFELRFEQMEGKDVICLNVYKGMETPYYYVGDGSRTAYIRIGNQSVQAKAHDLNRLVLNGVSQTYDSIASPVRCSRVFCTRWNGLDKANGMVDALMDSDMIRMANQSIEGRNQSIERRNQSIEAQIEAMHMRRKTKEYILRLSQSFPEGKKFGRQEIAGILEISPETTAGSLIKKMKLSGLIDYVKGHGKGKYQFIVK